MMKIPEIVAPGGSYTKAIVAAKFGAEAVYVGVPFTSLRMRQNKVNDFDELKKTVDAIKSFGSKALLTMNIFPRNEDIKIFESVVEQVSDTNPDAIIFSDPGTFNTIRKYLPKAKLHLSTQASTLNWQAVKFRYDLGVTRVVLARELHIDEVKEIKQAVPEMELEVFVHGAMCMSYSGRCLLGDYMAGRPGNKGECPHACRFKYKVWLQEERRPEKFFELGENENGSFILSSKDLCTIDRLGEIIPYVDAMKIEGRSKSEFYVGATVSAYKHVRDSIINGTPIDAKIKNLVYDIPHREYWDGFLFNKTQDYQDGETPKDHVSFTTKTSAGPIVTNKYYGLILNDFVEKDGKKYFSFVVKDNISIGDEFNVLSDDNVGKIKIIGLISKNNFVEKVDCNTPEVFINFDYDPNGLNILYR